MNTQLDVALQAASAAEATYNADVANVATIQTAISTASAPLAAAQAQLSTDASAFNATLDDLSAAALAAKVPVATAPMEAAKGRS
jgi:hypothetical protein